MFIAVPLLLPLIAVIAILVSPLWCVTIGNEWEKRTNKKRLLIFFFSSLVLTAILSSILWACGTLKVWDKEVWNYKILSVKHEEVWTTHETRTETYTTGSGKNKQTHTRTIHYTETHGPYWTATDEYGSGHGIGESVYQNWKKTWANEKKTGEHKGSAAGFSTAITGGIFECNWTKDFDRIFPWSDIHEYKNKVRYSDSVLKYKEPTKELEKKYPRPADLDNISPVILYGKSFSEKDVELWRRTSAELGPRCRVHPILVAFGPDVTRAVVEDILSAWRGPNKNELVTFAAFKGDEILWCEVHSWMDNTTLHATLRDELTSGKFTAKQYSDLLLKYVPKQWRKKDFRDFDYLKVEIHWGWKVGSLIASLAGLLGLFLLIDRIVSDSGGFDAIYGWRR